MQALNEIFKNDNNYFLIQQKEKMLLTYFLILVRVAGLASLEPPAKQSTGLFFRLSANTQRKVASS